MSSWFRSRPASSAAAALLLLATSCSQEPCGPNVLFVVWDTVRADRTSLYGYERETTPQLDLWAREASVFDDCRSTAGITVSSHAAMFTGLLPTENGADNGHQWLDDGHVTLAELLRDAGWRTYAWSANPHISSEENFTQGFETVEHPWDDATRERALAIVRDKVRGDRSSELSERVRGDNPSGWSVKAAGELAVEGLAAFLDEGGDERPWFAFVNWMEAHRPLVPPRALREEFLTPEEVARSYEVDLSWDALWAYTFGLQELPPADLEVVGGVYDAAVLELDGLFASLRAMLEERGELDETIVVLTSDHGEHLGEHHMLDHQFSLHDQLLYVPLVLAGPGIRAGRESLPVTTLDLFPTLLELCDVGAGVPASSRARSLLAPAENGRLRLAEYPAPFTKPFRMVSRKYPDWDPAPWRRSLRSITDGEHTLLAGSDGFTRLHRNGDQARDLVSGSAGVALDLRTSLEAWVGELSVTEGDEIPAADARHRNLLDDLGYSGSDED